MRKTAPPPQPPPWLGSPSEFCSELALRSNGKRELPAQYKGEPPKFNEYALHPIKTPRTAEAVLGKDTWLDDKQFERGVAKEAAKGPDFAGVYAVVVASCGYWCVNAVIADVATGKSFPTPFVGVVGNSRVTGERRTIEPAANSRLMIVRGSLEISYGQNFDDGLPGTFYYVWERDHLKLIRCDLAANSDSPH